jgi:tRNA wybutosine-synthesizing protein 2
MFCTGNVTEKLRVARLAARGETVVDLYAGIGYYTLPYLRHARAAAVHACEWNPHSAAALRRNVAALRLPPHQRCTVHAGDNRAPELLAELRGVADRVNLGLLPSSEPGWAVAAAALSPARGGWLHVHGNAREEGGRAWARGVAAAFEVLLAEAHGGGGGWSVNCRHLERVKSYAPHVAHFVADVECRPLAPQPTPPLLPLPSPEAP